MLSRLVTVLFLWAVLYSAYAQDGNVESKFSPKLKAFLAEHPPASAALSNVISEALTGRSFELYYWYSEDQSLPKASHDYGDGSKVRIFLRENQPALDEFVSLLFEVVNSEGRKKFVELFERAKTRKISKQDYVRNVSLQEFEAAKKTRDLLHNLNFRPGEVASSWPYQLFLQCPNDFAMFFSVWGRDLTKLYEREYDATQRTE